MGKENDAMAEKPGRWRASVRVALIIGYDKTRRTVSRLRCRLPGQDCSITLPLQCNRDSRPRKAFHMSVNQPSILILVDTSTTWGCEIIRGVDDYSHTRWMLVVETRGELERLTVPKTWRGDGIIARVTERSLAKQLKRLGIPVVNVSWSTVSGYPFPQVTPDEAGVGRHAARHLLDRGFRHFAYCGLPTQPNYVDCCEPAYVEELLRHGFQSQSFVPRKSIKPAWRAVTLSSLQIWLRSLPKPVGILAWGPERGRNVTDACRAAGLLVPDEVAVITTADDELLCGISHPPLSAVDERPRVVGYEAAALLDRIMSGRRPQKETFLIPPQRVVTRRSTDVFAVDEPDVAEALRFIRDHFVEPIDVRDVLNVVAISRRILEQKFRLILGRSPAAEIRRVRLLRATDLLSTTDWPISQIARDSGFAHAEGMNRVFQREIQQTPTGYRSQARRMSH